MTTTTRSSSKSSSNHSLACRVACRTTLRPHTPDAHATHCPSNTRARHACQRRGTNWSAIVKTLITFRINLHKALICQESVMKCNKRHCRRRWRHRRPLNQMNIARHASSISIKPTRLWPIHTDVRVVTFGHYFPNIRRPMSKRPSNSAALFK